MLFQTGPRALLGPTARVPGGSEPPGTASSDASELAVPGVRSPLALRLKIGLTWYLFWGVCAIKPQAKTTTSCCLLSGVLMCSVCPSSRFTLRPAASFPPVASSADLLRCRRKSVKHGEDILEGEENWHQEASSRGEGGVTLPAQVANHAWERLQRHGN